MKLITKILITILITLCISCVNKVEPIKLQVHKLKDGGGYCYQNENNLLWYILIYNNLTDTYDIQQTTIMPSYYETTETFTASQETVSNYEQSEMTETTGEDVGGSSDTSTDTDSGMSESSGSDSGGSDGDSGGGE